MALLRRRAEERPDRGDTWLTQGEEVANRLTFADLDRRARAIASVLTDAVPPGERALLLYSPKSRIRGGVLRLSARVIAVPAYPPHSRRPDPRLSGVRADFSKSQLLAVQGSTEDLSGGSPEMLTPGNARRLRPSLPRFAALLLVPSLSNSSIGPNS